MWGLGGLADFMMYNGISGMSNAIFVIGMGMNPKILGLAQSVPRLLDIILDPIIGHLSDNTRSRFGRRRPWMLAGALVSAVIVVMMWYPPLRFGSLATTVFVVSMMVLLFSVGYSMFTIPYTAQGYELSTDYNERTHIFKWRIYVAATCGFLSPWLVRLCLWVEGDAAAQLKGSVGVHWVSFGIAGLILLAACGPIFGCREGGVHRAEKKVRLRDAIKFTSQNGPFRPLLVGNFLVQFGMCVTGVFFFYLMVYAMSGGDLTLGSTRFAIFCNAINIATFLGMAPMVWLTDRLGKKPMLLAMMLASAIAYASVWFTLRPQDAAIVLDVTDFLCRTCRVPRLIAELWPALLTAAGIGVFCNSMPLVVNSMLADVCDVDELHCGHRREAFYGAIFVTCNKLALAMTFFLQGILVEASGYRASLTEQTPETIAYWMKALLLTQPTGFALGFVCVLFYSITRARAVEVRRLLDARSGMAAALLCGGDIVETGE